MTVHCPRLLCLSDVYIYPSILYLRHCNVSIGLCIFQFFLICPVCLIDWLTDWLHRTRMLNYSALQEILCHYENRNYERGTPSLEADQSVSCPHNQYLVKSGFNITLRSYWLQKWFLPLIFFFRIKILCEYVFQPVCNRIYKGWNFNFGNAAVTFDTAHLQSSYFHRPSRYSPKLCRTRSQRWGSRTMPLASTVLLMVRTERSTSEGLNPPCNCPIR